MAALEADFEAFAFHGVERFVLSVADPGLLRVEDAGVAGVGGPLLIEVVDHADVGDEHAGLPRAGVTGSARVGAVFGVAFPVHQAPAEDQAEVVGDVEAADEVAGVPAWGYCRCSLRGWGWRHPGSWSSRSASRRSSGCARGSATG